MLLPDTPIEGALRVADNARRELATLALAHAQSSTGSLVTFSAGIASLNTERDGSPRDLVSRADEALYRAKQLGRNRAVAV